MMKTSEIYTEAESLAQEDFGVSYANWDPNLGIHVEPLEQKVTYDGGSSEELSRVQSEFEFEIPQDVSEYLEKYMPKSPVSFNDGFEGIFLSGATSIGRKASGYSWNEEENEYIDDWERSWLFIAEGSQGRGYFVDLSDHRFENHFVFCWDEGTVDGTSIATSIAHFVLLLTVRSIYYTQERSREWLEGQIRRIEPNDHDRLRWWMPYEVEDE